MRPCHIKPSKGKYKFHERQRLIDFNTIRLSSKKNISCRIITSTSNPRGKRPDTLLCTVPSQAMRPRAKIENESILSANHTKTAMPA